MKKYDLVVLGAGLSGLSTAIAWLTLKRGRVLVLEKEGECGGCVASFRKQGYGFETAHLIPETGDLLEWLGVYCRLVRYKGTLSKLYLFRDGSLKQFSIPADRAAFVNSLRDAYPRDRGNIERFFEYCRSVYEELSRLPLHMSLADRLSVPFRCPRILEIANDTWEGFLNRFGFSNPEIPHILDLFSHYSYLSGDRCAALLTIAAMETCLESSWYAEPSFSALPETMRKRAVELGAEFRFNTRVTKINVQGGSVRGVLTAAGELIQADTVVSTVDTKVLLEDLLGEKTLEGSWGAWRRARGRVRMSPSMIEIHLGLDGDIDLRGMNLGGAYHVLTTGREALGNGFDRWDRGEAAIPSTSGTEPRRTEGYESFQLGFFSPSLGRGETEQTLVIREYPVSGQPWIELRERDREAYLRAKDAAAARCIGLLEKYVIPGLGAHIRLRDVSTPATFARRLGSTEGACFDMLSTVNQFGMRRLPLKGPFEGLFQTKYSHGIWPALHAGVQVLDIITKGAVMRRAVRYSQSGRKG